MSSKAQEVLGRLGMLLLEFGVAASSLRLLCPDHEIACQVLHSGRQAVRVFKKLRIPVPILLMFPVRREEVCAHYDVCELLESMRPRQIRQLVPAKGRQLEAYFRRQNGSTAQQLLALEFELPDLKGAGCGPEELKGAGCTAADLRAVGFYLFQLLPSFSLEELCEVGYGALVVEQVTFNRFGVV